MPKLDSRLQPLEKLIGTWKLTGRTLNAEADDVFGETTVQAILDGAYLEMRGHQSFTNAQPEFPSLEIIHYDPKSKTYPSEAYANMTGGAGGAPVPYEWIVEDDGTIVHRGAGATYRGRFSVDGEELKGGWRPDNGGDGRDEAAYNVTMKRV